MRIYNTLTHQVENFIPWNKDYVTMYTCGPTVYHYAHIGNLRTYIAEDILEKSLNYLGYKVKRCMNITDVGHLQSDSDTGEDKMVSSAKKAQDIPDNCLVFGSSPNLVIKQKTEKEMEEYFFKIWKN